jgi:peptidoglycan/xylan/chitin deacetylase (PgdA/CDA1 family)
MYHSISDGQTKLTVKPERFRAEMKYLADEGFRVLSLRDACERLNSNQDLSGTVVLTFDDGSRDFLTTAGPILEEHDFTATLFIVTRPNGSGSNSNGVNGQLLSEDDIKDLKGRGFSFGSHTVTHPDLTLLDESTLQRELADSRAAIAELGETFIPFAYPGGRFSSRERDAVERAGYDCALIVGGRWGNGTETDRFLLKREPMLGSDSLGWFKKRVNGFYEAHYLMARARGVETR